MLYKLLYLTYFCYSVKGEELEKLSPRVVRANSRCGVYGVSPNTPKPSENPSGVQRKRDEAMTSTSVNPHKS
jgi:hypothetical protein